MTCQNTGPIHLGISEEACENAGGKWFRTPCITLQETIDNRPARFNLTAPVATSCQDALVQMNLAYVATSTDHVNYTFTKDGTGCNEFCRMLPDYSNQLAIMTELSSSSSSEITQCVCLYQDGLAPSIVKVPEYATRSPTRFYLTKPSDGTTLGIPGGYDCTASEINIEAQVNANSTRQQFQITYDHQLVSVACPSKALTADCAAQKLVFKDSTFSQGGGEQKWSFNTDGTIRNENCSDVKLSAVKENTNTLESKYFSLVNPTASMVVGVEGDSTSCVDDMDITLQKAVPGSPNQLFYMEDGSDEIISVMCPQLAIAENLEASHAPSSVPSISLSTSISPTFPVSVSVWIFSLAFTIVISFPNHSN